MLDSILSGVSSGLQAFGESGAAGLLGSLVTGFADGALSNYYARKGASKQAKLNYEMANYTRQLDWEYAQKYNDLQWRNAEKQFDLASRYATNSASWQVQGLKAAGLNPILAAGGLGGTMSPSSSPSTPMPSGSGDASLGYTPPRSNLSGALLAASQMDLNRQTAKNLEAQSLKVDAETDRVRLDTKLQLLESLLDAQRGGKGNGLLGALKGIIGENNPFGAKDKKIEESIHRLINSLVGTLDDTPTNVNTARPVDASKRSALRGASHKVSHTAHDIGTIGVEADRKTGKERHYYIPNGVLMLR